MHNDKHCRVPRELVERAVAWFNNLAQYGMDAAFENGELTPNAKAMDELASQFSAILADDAVIVSAVLPQEPTKAWSEMSPRERTAYNIGYEAGVKQATLPAPSPEAPRGRPSDEQLSQAVKFRDKSPTMSDGFAIAAAAPSNVAPIEDAIVGVIRHVGAKANLAPTVVGAMCHEIRTILHAAPSSEPLSTGETPRTRAVDDEIHADPNMQPSAKQQKYRRLCKKLERELAEQVAETRRLMQAEAYWRNHAESAPSASVPSKDKPDDHSGQIHPHYDAPDGPFR